jgi:tetratricopeptide (TPR) repeat protein
MFLTKRSQYGLFVTAVVLGVSAGAWLWVAWRPRRSESSDDQAALAVRKAKELMARGRLADAEATLQPVATATRARAELANLLRLEGRRDEVVALLRDGWTEAADPVRVLQDLFTVETMSPAVDLLAARLDAAGRQAPEDDRVWLGQANLALRAGRLDEAGRRLAACLKRRPEDPAVWRARLDWSRARGDVAGAREALAHLPAARFTTAEWHELEAWFAARRGDTPAERRALKALLSEAPDSPGALERLIELALRAGETRRVADLRARQARLDAARKRYDDLIFTRDSARRDPVARALELVQVARTLGRTFEARAWATLAARQGSTRGGELVRQLGPFSPRTRASEPERAALLRRSDAATRSVGWVESSRPAGMEMVGLEDSTHPMGPSSRSARDELRRTPVVPNFVDDSASVGLTFNHRSGRSAVKHAPEQFSGGVGLLDYDGDGWLDVYVTQGGPFPPHAASAPNDDRLFHNRGDGTFEDATAAAGLASSAGGYGMGVAVGDYDNDGDPDLFVTRWGSYALYCNRGDGTFEDATDSAGLGGDRDWPTSAAFADLDNDGDLDLYVCHYLAWDPSQPRVCPRPGHPGERAYCAPRLLPALRDHLFRNDGGWFVEVTDESGIVDTDGRGLGVVAADLDGDGRVDLFVANDTTANALYRNLGGMHFVEDGATRGVAASGEGIYKAGMGVACADLDGDGRPDLVVGNFYGEGASLFRNFGGGQFVDQAAATGLASATRYVLSFGVVDLDANHDGRPDLAIANGHVDDLRPEAAFAMPTQLLLGTVEGRFVDVTSEAGPPWQLPRLGRALARGDLDNDGRDDLVLVAQDGPLAYFHNGTQAPGHWVTLQLEGTSSNRDAIGARVTIAASGQRQVSWRVGGGSYQSASDPRLHAGLGAAERIASVEVAWPSGRVDRYEGLKADAGYYLREGEGRARSIAGF